MKSLYLKRQIGLFLIILALIISSCEDKDEIFTNIDYPSIAAFTNMIRSKYAEDSAVYVITHQSEAIDILQPETVTTVIKENSSSRIETKMGA